MSSHESFCDQREATMEQTTNKARKHSRLQEHQRVTRGLCPFKHTATAMPTDAAT